MADLYTRYHVRVGSKKRRTTVSLDSLLAELFTVKLGYDFDTEDGHTAVREAIQAMLDKRSKGYDSFTSSRVREFVIREIANPRLLNKI